MSFRRLVFVLLLLGSAVDVGAITIDVVPGPGSPLQDAIDAAPLGATLRVHQGTYPGPVVVNKALKFKNASDDPFPFVEIDADCMAATALDIVAERVKIKMHGDVKGATSQAIRVAANHVKVQDLGTEPSCSAGDGIRVESASNVTVSARAAAFTTIEGWEAGVRFVDLPIGAGVKLLTTRHPLLVLASGPTGVGLVLENCANGSPSRRSGIEIRSIGARGTVGPVRFVASDGVISRSVGYDAVGPAMMVLDADSDNNFLMAGSIFANIVNDGSGNCAVGTYIPYSTALPECP